MNQNTIEEEIIRRARAVLGLRGYKKPELILLASIKATTGLPATVLATSASYKLQMPDARLAEYGIQVANATIEKGIRYE